MSLRVKVRFLIMASIQREGSDEVSKLKIKTSFRLLKDLLVLFLYIF